MGRRPNCHRRYAPGGGIASLEYLMNGVETWFSEESKQRHVAEPRTGRRRTKSSEGLDHSTAARYSSRVLRRTRRHVPAETMAASAHTSVGVCVLQAAVQ